MWGLPEVCLLWFRSLLYWLIVLLLDVIVDVAVAVDDVDECKSWCCGYC